MTKDFTRAEDWFLSVVSGRSKGATASIVRTIFAIAEPVYGIAIRARNFLYSRGMLRVLHARRPVVSVGNLTTGGTGKTPMVDWLVREMRAIGRTPAVLLRGYRSAGGASDEELLLRHLVAPSPVCARPDRFAASELVLADRTEVDVFVLDDGLQHRRLARDFSLVLIDATAPFGFGRILPRGLLREPISALCRANAVVITRSDLADPSSLVAIEERIHLENPRIPIFRCAFAQDRLVASDNSVHEIATLTGQSFFAFCGIGNPDAFFRQLQSLGGNLIGTRRFGDHHPYTVDEISDVIAQAKAIGASMLLMTEKDWVKIAPLVPEIPSDLRVMRVGVSVEFPRDDAAELLKLIVSAISN